VAVLTRLFIYVLDAIARPSIAAMSAHASYLRSLEVDETIVAAGTFRDGNNAVVCVLADSEARADELARMDPLVAFGFALYRLHEIESADQAAAHAQL
jgi:uncharacterized protein YciI